MKANPLFFPESGHSFGPCALTIGNFDGVHRGHRALVRQTQQIARSHSWNTVVLTFHPHPTTLVAPERAPEMICSLQERLRLLKQAGADRVCVLPFTREIAEMSPREFVETIVVKALGSHAVLVGQNFRFGQKQAGNSEVLAQLGMEFGCECHFLASITSRNEVVSSTAIRQHLKTGNVSKAGRLLGRCFSLEGPIVSGQGIGSKQTVPTLNLQPPPEIKPGTGVYITETEDLENGRRWQSITNVGHRPTFGGEGDLTIETFLLSPFDGKTPERIRLSFHRWIRPERTFENPQALRSQIMQDVSRAHQFWRCLSRFQLANQAESKLQ